MSDLGELHATFAYPTPSHAKRAWERAARACRGLSINRWALNPPLLDKQAVTVIGEEASRPAFERALKLLASEGERIDTPPHTLRLLREKREAMMASGDDLHLTRAPGGMVLGPGGKQTPFRRPQG